MARSSNIPSILSYMGHFQGTVYTTISEDKKKLVTMGQDDLILMWNIEDMTSKSQIEINNPNKETFTCFDYCQQDGVFVVGTESGKVLLIQQNNTLDFRLIYRGNYKITSLKYSPTYRFLAIGSQQDRGVVFDKEKSRFVRCDEGHLGQIIYAAFTLNENYMITIGDDGNTNIYNHLPQSPNPLQYHSKFKVCHKQELRNMINFSERPNHIGHISFGGEAILQQVSISEANCIYSTKSSIHQQQQIRNLCWINQYILILSTQSKVSLWNYGVKNKFHIINNLQLCPIVTDGLRFFGPDSHGMIHRYENLTLFQSQFEYAKKYEMQEQQQQNQPFMQPYHQQINEPQKEAINAVPIKKIKKKPAISKAAKLIRKLNQPGIQSHYQSYRDNQFLFYNKHGCVIKRIDGQEDIIQLQFHDKFKIRRIKFETRGKYFCFFALTESCFMYSNHSHAYFEMETYNRIRQEDGTTRKQLCFNKWDYKIVYIEGVAIGNSWVAIASKFQIRIFDFAGNELHCICFDRIYLAMAAYENLLVIAYTASIPLIQSNNFEIKIYNISDQSFKLVRKTIMPVKSQQELKWFGFSHEGCIFNQDTSQTIRMYCWETDQWVNVHEEDPTKYRMYIQHIENYEIYGFKIEQREGEPTGPTVLPRSIPRKILFQFPERWLKFFNSEQNKRLQSIYFRRLCLAHEKFRNKNWYKYKYSRNYDHYMYSYSESIKSQEQIKEIISQTDIFIVDQIKKILPNLQSRLKREEFQSAKFEILGACLSLVFYSEVLNKIKDIMGLNTAYDQFQDSPEPVLTPIATKYHKLNRLQAMADKGWIEKYSDRSNGLVAQ